ncbi:acyl carrier protein [Flavobacterium ardleyense]|uniref:acyl carrier protein n=1 Tax=Flavobacterium ardleyense TaxID=2038737 RepID=UPI00298D5831|nr:acyl carrier protein [Flavobacterium ardleyense]
MSNTEVLSQIEEVLDVNEGTLQMDMKLEDVEEYDSMAKLSLIVMSDDDFDKKLTAEQLNDFQTVGDIVKFLVG